MKIRLSQLSKLCNEIKISQNNPSTKKKEIQNPHSLYPSERTFHIKQTTFSSIKVKFDICKEIKQMKQMKKKPTKQSSFKPIIVKDSCTSTISQKHSLSHIRSHVHTFTLDFIPNEREHRHLKYQCKIESMIPVKKQKQINTNLIHGGLAVPTSILRFQISTN